MAKMKNNDARPESIDDFKNDVLKEIGNIGSGHVLTALSAFTNKEFSLCVPEVEFLDYDELPARLGSSEELRVSVALKISGDISGMFMFLADRELAGALLESVGLAADTRDEAWEVSVMQDSALKEIGNIISNSYINAICELTGLDMTVSVPAMAVDMLGSLLVLPIIHFAVTDSKILYVHSAFRINGENYNGNVILFPDYSSMETLLGAIAKY
ncbi:MAG: chemotaxis protein CheC [Cloacibacillus sp.]